MPDLGLGKIPYGGDWNPEQWSREAWLEDIRLFKAAGIDLLSINIFGWTRMQPDETTYDFALLDEWFELLHKNGMRVCLGTGTAAHPAWMATRYPDILRVDFQGRKRKFGDRHNSCPSSPTYRRFAPALASRLAARYKDHPALALWHVSNEFMGACYCENCEVKFREWLKDRYGSLEALNAAWNTVFWNQTLSNWDEVVLPNPQSVQWSERGTAMQPISLDYNRFNSENLLECYRLEYDAIKAIIPDAVITTNLMGAYRPLDYRRWAKHLDVVSWDAYPSVHQTPAQIALPHDLMRGLRDGEPFLLMEQTPNQTNWQPYNSLKRPGVMRLLSWQAVAHGADSMLFFQMRRSIAGCEKFHGAVIEHSGRSDTRVFREVSQLGAELKRVGDVILGSRVESKVALWFDWESWWAAENSAGPSVALNYLEEIGKYYAAFHAANITVDLVGPGSNLSPYEVLLTPVLYLLNPEDVECITAFVASGKTLVSGMLSGVANPNDRIFERGIPGPLRELLGFWVEEIDALPPEQTNRITFAPTLEGFEGHYTCDLIFEILRLETAQALATYADDFYAGTPIFTRNPFGEGWAYHIASSPDTAFLQDLVKHLCATASIKPVLKYLPAGVEAVRRVKGERSFIFLLNHSAEIQRLELGEATLHNLLTGGTTTGFDLPPKGVVVGEELR